MSYQLELYAFEDASEGERQAAEQRFRKVLDTELGDAALVLPVYRAYCQIVALYGEAPDPETLSAAQLQVFEQWQAAHAAAVSAAFGPHRYLEEASFEIRG